jgi:hypothetical protein
MAMTDKERDFFLRVYDGNENTLQYLYYLDCILPKPKLLPALSWLVKNKLTGIKFITWIKTECNGSLLEMVRRLTMHIENDKTPRKLFKKDVQ